MFNYSVTQAVLDQSRVVERLKEFTCDDNAGIREAKAVPEAITEDLTYLFRKWQFGDLGILARRGLIPHPTIPQYFVNSAWPYVRSADFFGNGHLVNGQTWGSRAEMMRDGAHAPPVAGISGTIKGGARSVVMGLHDQKKKQYYADIDQGDTIYYMGTALGIGKDDEVIEPTNVKDRNAIPYRESRITKNVKGQGPTNATKALKTSCQTGRPVRVFRSFRLAKIVPNRPQRGFRYDGLYVVKSFEKRKDNRQIYIFRMERLTEGQGPLRDNVAPPLPETGKRKRTYLKRNASSAFGGTEMGEG